MAFSRIVPLTRRDFFWDDPFFSNFWEDFEKLRSDIWKGNEDFFNRFNHQDNAPRPRLVGGKLINTSSGSFMKESSMEKSFKKESSSSYHPILHQIHLHLIQTLDYPEDG